MDLEVYVDLLLPIRIEWDDGDPYAVIDAPDDVQRWIADKLGVAGMASLDREARHHVEVERQNSAAEAAEYADSYRRDRAMALCDYGI